MAQPWPSSEPTPNPGRLRPRRFTTPRIAFNGVETGVGAPAVFLHGISANARVWDPILAQLEGLGRLVAVDQRGHGRSDKPERGYEAAHYADDIAALIESLDCGPALLVGHSLGARNALCCAVRRPDMVAGAVIVDFAPFIEKETFDALERRVEGGERRFSDARAVVAHLRQRHPRLPGDAIMRRARHGYREDGAGNLRPLADAKAMRATRRGLCADLAPTLTAVRVPALLVRGRDSALVTLAAWTQTKAARPDLQAVEVDGADHYVHEQQPARVAALVRAFWRGLGERPLNQRARRRGR